MVACGNMTVYELQNTRKDVTQNRKTREKNKTSRGKSRPEAKGGGRGLKQTKDLRLKTSDVKIPLYG